MQVDAVTDFPSVAEGNAFLDSLRTNIQQRQKDFVANRFSMTFGPVDVFVWSLDAAGAAAFAKERNSVARPTPITLFFNEGAVVACREFGLKFTDLGGEDKTLPRQAKQVINEQIRTVEPHASVRPA